MATHEEAMFPELEGLKCWREDKFQLKKFKKETRYPHKRSDGMTKRTNKGSGLQPQLPKKAVKSSRPYAVHPACEKCHRLYPLMSLKLTLTTRWAITTNCCDGLMVNWKFLVGTRKGKINLTVRSRVAAVQKRGVWLCMVL